MMDLPVYPFSITFLILLVIMVIRYFMLAGFFYYFSNKSHRPLITPISSSEKRTSDDIKWSVISSSVFALSGAILVNLWQSGKTLIYTDIGQYGFLYLIISLPLLMLVHDTYFYWTHRLLHAKVLFKRFHLAHHQSRIPTAWTSFAFHPGEALIQAIILPLMLMIIPVHWMILVAFLMIMTILGILNHLGREFYPPFMEKRLKFISATHHQAHHQKMDYNFGLYFTLWDELMKTERVAHG